MGKQLEILENHADTGPQGRQIGLFVADGDAIDGDLPLLERFQPVDGLDQRRFAGAGRPANDHHIALFHPGAALPQHLELAIPFTDVVDFDHMYAEIKTRSEPAWVRPYMRLTAPLPTRILRNLPIVSSAGP